MSTSFEAGQAVSIRHRDRTYTGEIVKVGRILVDIRYNGRVVKFLQNTRRALGTRAGPAIYFGVPDDADRRYRARQARQLLASHGVELSPRRTFTVEQVEALAEVISTWPR